MKTHAERITKARDDAQLSKRELADLIGVTSAAVSAWERGVHIPRPAHLRALERVLGVDQRFLSTDSPKRGPLAGAGTGNVPEECRRLLEVWPRLTETERSVVLGTIDGILARVQGDRDGAAGNGRGEDVGND